VRPPLPELPARADRYFGLSFANTARAGVRGWRVAATQFEQDALTRCGVAYIGCAHLSQMQYRSQPPGAVTEALPDGLLGE
jgi:hypothetical protein